MPARPQGGFLLQFIAMEPRYEIVVNVRVPEGYVDAGRFPSLVISTQRLIFLRN